VHEVRNRVIMVLKLNTARCIVLKKETANRMKQSHLAVIVKLVLCCGAGAIAAAQPPTPQSQTKAPDKPSDTLAKSVHHQIQVLPFYSVFDNIESRVDGNRVTLTGQVLRNTLKNHAEAAVKDLGGVTTVSNQIEVLPASSSDDDLRTAIYRALFEDNVLKKYAAEKVPSIHIIVKDGNVVLVGTVQNDSDRKLAGDLAGRVPNSKSLQNHLAGKSR
jgi:hyperosmotically inducible protein